MEEDRPPNTKAKLTEVNSQLTCPLCNGYYIDATTIVECLHSFCKSCIIQHLQQDNYCPICDLMINTAKPNIKADKTLQDIVYKLVPGLYASEMARRRRFWAERPTDAAKVACPEARGLMTERIIFSPQDAISLSIEYTSDEPAAWQRSEPDPEVPLRRYLQCPAMLRVEHLKKFICNKYNVDSHLYHVDILYKRVPLPDHYTLMDIAYIYSWKRNEPMKFFFRITDIALVSERFDYFEPSSKQTVPAARCQQQRATTKQHIITNNNNIEQKSASSVRQHANKDVSSDVIKTCESDSKQTEQKCDSDKKPCSEKKDKKEVVNSDENKCEKKCDIIEKSSDIKQKEVVNNNQKEISNKSDNKKCDKSISENSETNKVKVEKVVVKIECEVKVEKDENIENNSNTDSLKINSLKTSDKTKYKTYTSKTQVLNNDSKVPINNKSEKFQEKQITSEKPAENIPKLNVLKLETKEPPKINEPKLETNEKSPIVNQTAEDAEKSEFLMSFQLTSKNSPPMKNTSPPALKPINPEIFRLNFPALKRKYVRKSDKSPNTPKRQKLAENKPNEHIKKATKPSNTTPKTRKVASKTLKDILKESKTSENDPSLKIKNIKNPIVRHMVNNLNEQATNVTKIVGQTDGSKLNHINEQNQNEQLQSLIDSCKLNIPSSLSITLTESPRNEDGTVVQSKPVAIKPVQNYIEILKLPDKNVSENSENSNDNLIETPLKSDSSKSDSKTTPENKNVTNAAQSRNSGLTNSQKLTFQTMFEETIKRNDAMKAQLFELQTAKSVEIAKKQIANVTSNAVMKVNIPKPVKKQQNNALDLSKTSPKSESSSPNSNNSHNVNIPNTSSSNLNTFINSNNIQNIPKIPMGNGHKAASPNSTSHNGTNKRNILEIAHQLSKRSRMESETLKIPNTVSPNSTTIPKGSPNPNTNNISPNTNNISPNTTSPPQQIIINSNFSSGGSMSIKRSPKKMPIPRLPVAKVPTPKLNPPNIRNGGLLKFSNYTAKLATNSANLANNSTSHTNPAKSPTKSPNIPSSISPSSTKTLSPNNTIHGLTPNQLLEKYNITNLAQFNANLNQAQAQLAFQQALMVSHQLEMHRMQQQNSQKHWMSNPNILAHYENYVQSLKNQQNQIIGNSSKN